MLREQQRERSQSRAESPPHQLMLPDLGGDRTRQEFLPISTQARVEMMGWQEGGVDRKEVEGCSRAQLSGPHCT